MHGNTKLGTNFTFPPITGQKQPRAPCIVCVYYVFRAHYGGGGRPTDRRRRRCGGGGAQKGPSLQSARSLSVAEAAAMSCVI